MPWILVAEHKGLQYPALSGRNILAYLGRYLLVSVHKSLTFGRILFSRYRESGIVRNKHIARRQFSLASDGILLVSCKHQQLIRDWDELIPPGGGLRYLSKGKEQVMQLTNVVQIV